MLLDGEPGTALAAGLRIGDGAVGAEAWWPRPPAFWPRETLPDAVEKALAYVSTALSALAEPV
jgi:hypothetical protein